MALVYRRDTGQVARTQERRSEWRASLVSSQELLRYIGALLIVLVALAGLTVYVVDSITHHPVDSITLSLLTFATGVIATLTGVHLGSSTNASGTQAGADISTQAVTPLVTNGTNGNGVPHQ